MDTYGQLMGVGVLRKMVIYNDDDNSDIHEYIFHMPMHCA